MEPLFYFIVLIFSVVIHEVSHGFSAKAQGDDTAEIAGRLTLNPIKHIDPIGSVFLPLTLFLFSRISGGPGIIFGWAKPVPYAPWKLRNQRWGPALVAVAGPASNFALAILFGLGIRFFGNTLGPAVVGLFSIIVLVNILLGTFNLVPLPPLDGSKILFAFLPEKWRRLEMLLTEYGLFLLLIFIFFGFGLLIPIIFFLFRSLAGISFPAI